MRRALKLAFPFRKAVLGILLLTLLVAVINAIEPLVLRYIFDNLTTHQLMRSLMIGIGGLVGLGIFREIATAFSNQMTWHCRLGLHYNLLDSTVERLHRMPLSFHRKEGVGAIMTKLDRSIQGFVGAVSQILFNIFPAVLYLLISLVIMFYLNWKLALLVLAFLPLPAAIAAFAGPEQNRRERRLLDRWSRIYSRFNEVLSGIVTVRSFSMEEAEKRRFLEDVHEANQIVVRGVGIDAGVGAATNLVVTAARIAAVAFGGMLIVQGKLTVGTLIAFLGYVGGLFGPVQGLTGIYQTIQKAYVSLDEIFSILDEQEHLGDAINAREVIHVQGEVIFKGVHFRYEEASRPLLRGIDLVVKSGETLAIVGPSGSGKTTLMALLMRFYDPDEGAIYLDGEDLRKLKQRSLRTNIGTVLQDPLLFNDTVRNNIAYGRPEASLAEIEAAAKAANAHDFISHLPEGYETMVGERGSRLSVGERQRITIARALIKNPPILVLDEATSSLDAESEALVQEALNRLMKERTTFVIAHRLSTVVNANRIIVLKHGLVVESGTHAELMKLGGYYAALVKRQTGGLIHNEGEWSQSLATKT
ncbi:ABC transporter ATP-binding protein [Pedosphaera parvula]|uniref:ABC transporter related-protein n=1 Tax=Pedosphaera parvula (strain Ellin514) TaxID=320771 RepID=B9XGQ5_PEDPL|nr:ABC transporter ATP-binding protein [Pedosphaera parvula]EEF61106.1 ABC transporter related-protein [Pedosphaera parvula Ellin514]